MLAVNTEKFGEKRTDPGRIHLFWLKERYKAWERGVDLTDKEKERIEEYIEFKKESWNQRNRNYRQLQKAENLLQKMKPIKNE